jgi:dCTP deaminase
LPGIADFIGLIPPVILNAAQLHGVLNSAWLVWLNEREKMLGRLNTEDNSKCYSAINNLVEKSIGNYITIQQWNKAADAETVAPTQKPTYVHPNKRKLVKTYGTLNKQDILNARRSHELVIRPLLSEEQIGEVGIDFRLGYDFLVSVQGRDAFINASKNEWIDHGTQHNVKHFFQSTRRQIGETFILHPHQTVLAVTLEYVKLPEDCLLELVMRSSYARLGITINTIAQPGYAGCLNLELTNNNNNPINLAVGARVIQGILHRVSRPSQYFRTTRKYVCQVRPEPSAVINDKDLDILNKLWKQNNNQTT